MVIVTVTEEESNWLRCRRQWHYSSLNRMALTKIINAPALSLGSLIHATLEQWRLDPSANPVSIYDSLCVIERTEVILTYTEHFGYEPTPEELEPTRDAMHVGHAMIENYREVWKTPLPPAFKLISSEQTIIVPIPGTEHCECNADNVERCCGKWGSQCQKCIAHCSRDCVRSHYLEGTLDFLVDDIEHDRPAFGDVKTYGKTPNLKELDRKRQFTGYCWLLQQSGIAPEMRHCHYDGLNKRVDPIRGKTLADNFIRRTLPRSQHAIDEYGRTLAMTVNEMANPQVNIYPQIPFMGCWDCSFEELCDAETNGEDLQPYLSQYVTRESKLYSRYVKLWSDD